MGTSKVLLTLSKFLLIVWASVWIAALPLFHTHLPSIFQQPVGLPHTVFSPDLPGEYWAFSHKTTPEEFDLSVLAFNSPELGFIASWENEDKKQPLWEQSSVLIVPSIPPPLLSPHGIQALPGVDPTLPDSSRIHGLRAPPAPVSL